MPTPDLSHPDPTPEQEQDELVPGVQAQNESSLSATLMSMNKENVGFVS